ncbi:Chaperone protein DnaJ [Tritrichomonas foetus]|uniref:Chaperone protein DnaJ n=1 Tax=Tritrichomonas foetus TaxID=1144522 RepID=A0A1J4K966_9EUKA|nr:Chaperone protein DnaJ [Tritrichomonas foetus]|eukprot:OHT07432.1 Chaperone protein DnaJ [Tritrichomonas foetus]
MALLNHYPAITKASFFTRAFAKVKVNWQAENFYDRLGVKKDATQDEIKKKYHEIAKSYHPDVLRDPEEKKEGEKIMSAVNAAYDILKDEKSRNQYDQQAAASPFPSGYGNNFNFNNFNFNNMNFNNMNFHGPGFNQAKQVFREMVHLTFEESIFGCSRIVNLDTTTACQKCNGNGTHDGKPPSICQHCGGQGVVLSGFFMAPCGICQGRGYTITKHCRQCQGSGRVPHPTKLSLKIPAGVENGSVLNFSSPEGSVLVICKVKEDPLLRRDGEDIHVTVPISVKTAILGGVVEIPTLKGVMKKKVLPGTQPNNVERMEGAGVTQRGSLFIHYKLILPKSLSRKDKKMFEGLDDKYMRAAEDMWNSNLNAFQERMKPFQK